MTQPVVTSQTSAAALPGGDRLAVTTSTTAVPQPDSFFTRDHVQEMGSVLGLLGAFLVYVERKWEKRRKNEREALDSEFKPIRDAISNFESKENLARDKGEMKEKIDKAQHDARGALQSIEALKLLRNADVERLIKLEVRQENIERGQAEIKTEMRDGFNKLEKLILARQDRDED